MGALRYVCVHFSLHLKVSSVVDLGSHRSVFSVRRSID